MSDKKHILEKIKQLYTESLEKYGIDSKAVGWSSGESHILRFKKLLEVIEDAKEPIEVNDLGCGYGALYIYMLENGFNVVRYNGYDISEKMLKAADDLIGHSEVVHLYNSSSISTIADYSFASGIFNVKFDYDCDEWIKIIKDTLQNMFEYSRRGFAFNLLSTYVDYKEPHLYYGDPLYFFDFCKRSFSRKVSLLHDYDLWEWTILVKRV